MDACGVSITQKALGIQQTGPRTVIVPADPIIWDAGTSYEYLTLVASSDFGQAYIAKKDVPSGTPLTNTEYWIPAASYNAQLTEIQRQISALSSSVTEETERATNRENEIEQKTTAAYPVVDEETYGVSSMETYVQAESSMTPRIVANPNYAYVQSVGSMSNPYGLLRVASSYFNVPQLVYGNNWTATNLNDAYTDWEPASSHKNADGTMNIDCATFTQLVCMGVFYNLSSYLKASNETRVPHQLFGDALKTYVNYGFDSVPASTRRLLTGQLAKMLHDAGLLVKIETVTQIKPGMVLFHSDDSDTGSYHWEDINHCSMCVNLLGNVATVIESSTRYAGAGNGVNYRVLSGIANVTWGYMPTSFVYSPMVVQSYFLNTQISNGTYSRTAINEGYIVLCNAHTDRVTFTVNVKYPTVGGQTAAETTINTRVELGTAQSIPIMYSKGCTVTITGQADKPFTIKLNESPQSVNYEPYRPQI